MPLEPSRNALASTCSIRAANVIHTSTGLRGLLSLLLLCGCVTWAAAHDPVIVDEDVTIDASGRVSVVTHVRQAALLALIGSPRARLRDRAELDRDLPALAAMLAEGLDVAADGQRLALGDLQVAEEASGTPPRDPVALATVGTAPVQAQRLVLRFAPGQRLPMKETMQIYCNLATHRADHRWSGCGTSTSTKRASGPQARRWDDAPRVAGAAGGPACSRQSHRQ